MKANEQGGLKENGLTFNIPPFYRFPCIAGNPVKGSINLRYRGVFFEANGQEKVELPSPVPETGFDRLISELEIPLPIETILHTGVIHLHTNLSVDFQFEPTVPIEKARLSKMIACFSFKLRSIPWKWYNRKRKQYRGNDLLFRSKHPKIRYRTRVRIDLSQDRGVSEDLCRLRFRSWWRESESRR